MQQVITAMKTVTKIILGNEIELLQLLIHQWKQHPKRKKIIQELYSFSKTDNWSGKGISIPDHRDMINQGDDADVTNNEIKSLLINKFGDSISFCGPEKKKQSFAFFSSIEVQGEINSLRNIDVVKTVAIEVRK